ncbi:diamine n-acetyltransferase [Holotrichia oblita]|uniref:Diamine n-acetyltransferase n=1 Tax=Holotrichia oblita TaxID=644536 RepID=A0ACB9TCM8_HOLOL|nr:diamine n-acetyltransferase [Holotrichia oblita]
MLVHEGFEINPPGFTCFIAKINDAEIIGYAMYRKNCISSRPLYVDPEYRKYGVGKRLFLEVAKVAYETEGKKLDLHCLSWYPALTFYEKIGGVDITKTGEYHLLRLKEDTLNRMFK